MRPLRIYIDGEFDDPGNELERLALLTTTSYQQRPVGNTTGIISNCLFDVRAILRTAGLKFKAGNPIVAAPEVIHTRNLEMGVVDRKTYAFICKIHDARRGKMYNL